jgi:hypothetical protein
MSIRYIDGFEDYATADITNGNWNSNIVPVNAAISAGNGREGSCLRFSGTQNRYVTKTFDNQVTWIIGFAFRTGILPDTLQHGHFITLYDGVTVQASLHLNIDGTLQVCNGQVTVVTGGQSVSTLSINTWYYIEFKVTIADSIGAGTCKVRVNGVDWITVATGQDLKAGTNAFANAIGIGPFASGSSGWSTNIDFDDLYIADGVAGAVSGDNDFLGDVRVESLFPTGAGTTTNWTPDSGSNYARVNEVAPDTTSYVASSTVNNIDTYAMGNLSSTPLKIWAVQSGLVCRKMDAGSRSVAPVVRGADGDKIGATISVYDSYFNQQQVYEQNPLTSPADWTETSVNGIEMGFKLIA